MWEYYLTTKLCWSEVSLLCCVELHQLVFWQRAVQDKRIKNALYLNFWGNTGHGLVIIVKLSLTLVFNGNTFFLPSFLVWFRNVFLQEPCTSPLSSLGVLCRMDSVQGPSSFLVQTDVKKGSHCLPGSLCSQLVWLIMARRHQMWGFGPQHPLLPSPDLPCPTALFGNKDQAADICSIGFF